MQKLYHIRIQNDSFKVHTSKLGVCVCVCVCVHAVFSPIQGLIIEHYMKLCR